MRSSCVTVASRYVASGCTTSHGYQVQSVFRLPTAGATRTLVLGQLQPVKDLHFYNFQRFISSYNVLVLDFKMFILLHYFINIASTTIKQRVLWLLNGKSYFGAI